MRARKTNPMDYVLDWLFWPIIKLIWEPFSKKRSHWWHWKKYLDWNHRHKNVRISGKASKVRNSFWSTLWQTNFAWQNVVILKLENVKPGDSFYYQVGYSTIEKIRKIEICSILIPCDQEVALLVGPDDVEFFAVNATTQVQMNLRIVKETTKDKLGDTALL